MQAPFALDLHPSSHLPLHSFTTATHPRSPSHTTGVHEKVDISDFPAPPLYPSPPMSKSPTPPRSFTTPTSSSNAPTLSAPGFGTGAGGATSPHDYVHFSGGQRGHARHQSIQTPEGTMDEGRPGRALQYQSSQPSTAATYGPLSHPPHFEAASYPSESMQYDSAITAPTVLPPTPRPVPSTRRTKTHVQSACFNCKKAHLSCDVSRPCNRCVASGKQDSCFDVEHKKRGRPRLRDERGNKVASNTARPVPRSPQAATPAVAGPPRLQIEPRPADSLRVLKSQDVEQATRQGQYYPQLQHPPQSPYSQPMYSHPSDNSRFGPQPIAFLDMDLKIARTNHVFRNVFAQGIELHAKHLEVLVDQGDRIALQDLRRQLRDERDTSHPEFMSPIVTGLDLDRIPPVEAVDLQRISHAFSDHPVPLRFRFPDNQYASMIVSLRLAKADVYFVSITLPPVADNIQYQNTPYSQPRPEYQGYGMPSQYGLSPSFNPNQQYLYGPGGNLLPSPRAAAPSTPSTFYNFQNVAPSLPSTMAAAMGQPRSAYDTSYLYSQMHASSGSPYGYAQGSTGQNMSPHEYRQSSGYSPAPYSQHVGPSHDNSASGVQLPPISSGHTQVRQNTQVPEQPNPSPIRGVVRRRETDSPSEEDVTGRKRRRLNIHEVLD